MHIRPLLGQIKELFVDSIQKKYPGLGVNSAQLHVVAHDGRPLPDDTPIRSVVKEHDELHVQHGAPPATLAPAPLPPTPTSSGALEPVGSDDGADGFVPCRNYGCRQRFQPDADSATLPECRHHTGPPMFRDGKKAWSCCPTKGEYEWDDFLAVAGCAGETPCDTMGVGVLVLLSGRLARVAASAASNVLTVSGAVVGRVSLALTSPLPLLGIVCFF